MSPGKAEVSFVPPELDGPKKYKLIMCQGNEEYEGLETPIPVAEVYAFEPGFNFDKKVVIFSYVITETEPRLLFEENTNYEMLENGRYTLMNFDYTLKNVTDDLTVNEHITESEVVMDNKKLKIRVNSISTLLNGEFEGEKIKSGYKGDCVEHPDLETIDDPIKHF